MQFFKWLDSAVVNALAIPGDYGGHALQGNGMPVERNNPDPKSPIGIVSLMRFGDYAQVAGNRPFPVSFREFMGPGRSHRALVETANAIEQRSQKLVMPREMFGRDGKKMPEIAERMEDLGTGRSRRLTGRLTTYGRVWGLLGVYIKELIEVVLDEKQDEQELTTFLYQQRHELLRYTGKAMTRAELERMWNRGDQ